MSALAARAGRSVRLWVLVLAGTAFLAGTAGGVLAAHRLVPPPAVDRGPFADYEELLIDAYDLSPERARRLRAVLELYRRDLEEVRSRNLEELAPELDRVGRTCRARVRQYVLPEEHRAAYDAAAPDALPSLAP